MIQEELERYATLCALTKVQLYCNRATSEVTGEYLTLHDAIAISPEIGATLICNGVRLASYSTAGWLFESAGIERLGGEFNAIVSFGIDRALGGGQ